jgi:glycosyltransferase involved in cell wall biosynthesis
MARICIDGFNMSMAEGSGIATYGRNLCLALSDLGYETQILFSSGQKIRSNNLLSQVELFDSPPSGSFSSKVTAALRMVPPMQPRADEVRMTGDVITTEVSGRFPPADRVWASPDIFHSANRAHRAFRRVTPVRLGADVKMDVMHWTCLLPLFEPRIANVYTLHDLIPLRLPYTTLDDKRSYFDLCKSIVARADRIFTVSEHSRADIIQLLGVEEDRIVNTYQSVSLPAEVLDRTDLEIADELNGVFGLEPGGYFLFVGSADPKKNLRRIVEAYASSLVRAPLVVIGSGRLGDRLVSWADDDMLGPSQAHGAVNREERRIRKYDYLPLATLMKLVRGARATLFPSLYEGFGLPALESMLLGAPVLTSTQGALPEVVGKAALMVDPYDVKAIREGIRALDSDAGLRKELADRGRRQAAKFSPERYRERLKEAYAPVL